MDSRRLSIALAAALVLLALGASAASAASLQPLGKFEDPIYVTSDPGNPERLFVVERAGRIVEVEGGRTATYANIEAAVSCCAGEGGLLSIAPAPDFDSSGRIYVDYTGKAQTPGEIHVAELHAGTTPAPAWSSTASASGWCCWRNVRACRCPRREAGSCRSNGSVRPSPDSRCRSCP